MNLGILKQRFNLYPFQVRVQHPMRAETAATFNAVFGGVVPDFHEEVLRVVEAGREDLVLDVGGQETTLPEDVGILLIFGKAVEFVEPKHPPKLQKPSVIDKAIIFLPSAVPKQKVGFPAPAGRGSYRILHR